MVWMPHGQCVGWDAALLLVDALANMTIAIAYFAIPFALMVIAKRLPHFKATPLVWMFAAFILSCGATHIMDIVTVWWPYYWLDAFVKVFTAISSALTAYVLWVQSPKIASYLPSEWKDDGSGSGR